MARATLTQVATGQSFAFLDPADESKYRIQEQHKSFCRATNETVLVDPDGIL